MKKKLKTWLDNLMWRFRYIPMSRVEGGLLIANKEKFEIAVLTDQYMISVRDLEEFKPLVKEQLEQIHKEQLIDRVARKIVDMGEWEYEEPHKDAWYRYRFQIYIAIKKK